MIEYILIILGGVVGLYAIIFLLRLRFAEWKKKSGLKLSKREQDLLRYY